MDSARHNSMRTSIILFVLMCSLFAPLASATAQSPQEQTLDERINSGIIETYSPIVQAAIAHKSDLSLYSDEELANTAQWVVFAAQYNGEPAKELPGAWIVEADASTAIEDFSQLINQGGIEAA